MRIPVFSASDIKGISAAANPAPEPAGALVLQEEAPAFHTAEPATRLAPEDWQEIRNSLELEEVYLSEEAVAECARLLKQEAGVLPKVRGLAQPLDHLDSTCEDPNAFAIRIEDKSMARDFLPGDLIVFTPNRLPVPGDAVFVQFRDGRAIVRYLRTLEPASVELSSPNGDYPPLRVGPSEISAMYPALELHRRMRQD